MAHLLVINYKSYKEASGQRGVELARAARELGEKHGVDIVVAPPASAIAEVKRSSGIRVFAQSADDIEALKRSGADGAMINHSDHPVPAEQIAEQVAGLNRLGMTSIVCVTSAGEAFRYAKLRPTYIAIEPPELIGTGHAVSNEKPELITAVEYAVRKAGTGTKLLAGAGIASFKDAKRAVELGAVGVLVSSGIVMAPDPVDKIETFARALQEGAHAS